MQNNLMDIELPGAIALQDPMNVEVVQPPALEVQVADLMNVEAVQPPALAVRAAIVAALPILPPTPRRRVGPPVCPGAPRRSRRDTGVVRNLFQP